MRRIPLVSRGLERKKLAAGCPSASFLFSAGLLAYGLTVYEPSARVFPAESLMVMV
jgi:hypothetical protein